MPTQRAEPKFDYYIRSSKWFGAGGRLDLGPASLRFFKEEEARRTAMALATRNPFARHNREGDFYAQQALKMADHVVVEVQVILFGSETYPVMRKRAASAEEVALVGTIPWISREKLHGLLGPEGSGRGALELLRGLAEDRVKARSARVRLWKGIELTRLLLRRMTQYGVASLGAVVLGAPTDVVRRLTRAVAWLAESRIERASESAFVKTMIGFEALLGLNKGEPLRQGLSERVAFLLGRSAQQRIAIAKLTKEFYDLRSSIVHGGRSSRISEATCESLDRLLLLTCLALAAHHGRLKADADIAAYFEEARWAVDRPVPGIPFPESAIDEMMAMKSQDSR